MSDGETLNPVLVERVEERGYGQFSATQSEATRINKHNIKTFTLHLEVKVVTAEISTENAYEFVRQLLKNIDPSLWEALTFKVNDSGIPQKPVISPQFVVNTRAT